MSDCASAKNYLNQLIVIIICSFGIVSCVLSTEDISSNPEFANIIGKIIKTKTELWATGITLDQNYQNKIDVIMLVPSPGFTGPEVVTRNQIKTGLIFEIIGVLKTNSVINPTKYYLVKEINSNTYKNHPVWIMITDNVQNDNFGLDKSIYEKL